MRKLIVFLLLVVPVAACKKTEVVSSGTSASRGSTRVVPTPVKGRANVVVRTDIPTFMEKSLLGSKLGPDGNVATESARFRPGEPVSLTLYFHESPPGLQASVRWFSTTQKPFAHEERPMNGGKVVTFTLKSKLKPGHYRAEGYWGGNLAADKKFEVAAK